MSTSTLSIPTVTSAASAPEMRLEVNSAASRAVEFDGLRWIYRNGFDRTLRALPARAWSQPEKQGWERVKKNARREVWSATIAGEAYYLKYYFRQGLSGRIKRFLRQPACLAEWNGGMYALRHGIAAVTPAGYALNLTRNGRPCGLLVTEAAERAEPLSDFWLKIQSDRDLSRRRADAAQLSELLAELIARAHQAGFEHLDMHAANILVQPVAPRKYRALLVDLHSARLGVPLRDGAVVRNLAQLNQWFKRNSNIGDRLRFLRAYLRWRNEFEHAFRHSRPLGFSFRGLVLALARAAAQHADRLWSKRDRRIRRDGSYFTSFRLGGGWRALAMVRCKHASDESPASEMAFEPAWWRKTLAQPLGWFKDGASTACKDSHSAQVRRAELQHGEEVLPVIIKRPVPRNLQRRVAHCLVRSRSARGWATGHALLNRDLAAARPVALLERRVGPFVRDSVLITEALPEGTELESYLRRELDRSLRDVDARFAFTCGLARHMRRFHERGFLHRDCKAGNILVVPPADGGPPHLLWIDMDGIRRRGKPFQQRDGVRPHELRALMRLHVSLLDVPGLTRSDRARFLKHYLARFGAPRGEWRSVWRAIAPAAEQKLRRKEARRAWKMANYGRP